MSSASGQVIDGRPESFLCTLIQISSAREWLAFIQAANAVCVGKLLMFFVFGTIGGIDVNRLPVLHDQPADRPLTQAHAGRCLSIQALMSAITPSLPTSLRRSWKCPSYSLSVLSLDPAVS